jgi:magnesium transporter
MLSVRHLSDGRLTDVAVDRLPALLDAQQGVIWIDMAGGDDAQLAVLRQLGIDEWVAEDVLQTSTHPKAELHPDYLFLVVHAVDLDTRDERFDLGTQEIDAVLGRCWLVTHSVEPMALTTRVARLADETLSVDATAGDLLHLLLDTLVDEYEPFVNDFIPTRVDQIETALFDDHPAPAVRREIQLRRRDVLRLSRVAGPQAVAVAKLCEPNTALADRTRDLMVDIGDRLKYVAAQTENLHQQLDTAFDHYQSVVANGQNEIMKVLTMVSATLLPITVITGVYGMNFEHMPELQRPWAYPVVLAVCGLIVVFNLTFFYLRGWIGRRGKFHRAGHALQVGAGRVLRTPAIGARVVGRSAARLAPTRLLGYPRRQPPR